jgi:hypothetical protein
VLRWRFPGGQLHQHQPASRRNWSAPARPAALFQWRSSVLKLKPRLWQNSCAARRGPRDPTVTGSPYRLVRKA